MGWWTCWNSPIFEPWYWSREAAEVTIVRLISQWQTESAVESTVQTGGLLKQDRSTVAGHPRSGDWWGDHTGASIWLNVGTSRLHFTSRVFFVKLVCDWDFIRDFYRNSSCHLHLESSCCVQVEVVAGAAPHIGVTQGAHPGCCGASIWQGVHRSSEAWRQ